MSRRRFFSTETGSRHRSWAECYAWSSSESDGSGRESPDQSHTVAPADSSSLSPHSSSPRRSSTSFPSPQASPSPSTHHHHSPSSRPPSPASSEHRVFFLPRAELNSGSRPSATASRIQRVRRSGPQGRSSTPCFSEYMSAQHQSRRRSVQIFFRRTHRGRRQGMHLPVTIPSSCWYTGVGSLVCAHCQTQRSFQRTSWMCLECRVPLCLYTWRNCYSQWHSGE